VTAGFLFLELRDDAAAAAAGAAPAAAAVVGDGLRRAAPEMDTFPRDTCTPLFVVLDATADAAVTDVVLAPRGVPDAAERGLLEPQLRFAAAGATSWFAVAAAADGDERRRPARTDDDDEDSTMGAARCAEDDVMVLIADCGRSCFSFFV
jgi:hypothetical protein